MNSDSRLGLPLLAGVVVGYWLLMRTNPVRPSFRDGWRCLRRYKAIWLLPTGFALAHAGFNLWVHVYEAWSIPGREPLMAAWNGWQPPLWTEVWSDSLLPASESTTAPFNCILTTFPLSALGAVAFLCNRSGWQGTLFSALRRRFGWLPGSVVQFGIILCAVAALGKPFLFGGLPRLNAYFGELVLLRAGEVVNWLSFLFEYLLGIGVQMYLILLSFAWMRGSNFNLPDLRRFVLRRFVFVVKWAAVVMLISSIGMNLPLILASFQLDFGGGNASAVVTFTRWLLTGVLALFCSVQILLVFHNESLREVMANQVRLWRQHGWFIGWLIAIAGLHFFMLSVANAFLLRALGTWTWPGVVWTAVLHPVTWSILAAWLLASWVCLFRRCERNQPGVEELVRF